VIFLAFLALFNWYTFQHIADRWDWAQQHLIVFWIASLAFFLLEMYWIASAMWFTGHRHSSSAAVKKIFVGFYYASFLALGIFSCQFLYTFAGDIFINVLKFAAPALAADFERYNLPVLCAMTFITILAGMFQVNRGPFVEMVDVPLKNLPPAFEGFKIVQISDLHLSPTIKRPYAERVVHMVNVLKPDLIALTGDFVDGTVEELRNDAAPLAELSAPHGVWFVTGNHEYYWNPYAWMEEFKKLGARVLVNEHEVIRKGEGAIVLAGVSDYSTRHSSRPDAFSPKKSLEGSPPGLVKILLAHQSVSYQEAHAAGFDLQLSGHTHAGQYFPYTLLIRFFQRYYKGLNNHEGMWVYVNTGTGYWGPPLRAGVPAEISLLTLTRAPS
jgi:predicted MPP superfamily phosphohydrolase